MTTSPPQPMTTEISDRELDALVAERVFGCRVIRYSTLSVGCGCSDEIHARGGDELKPFSGNMNDAMLVVERMRNRGFGVCIDDMMGKPPWRVSFDNGSQSGNMRDESLPRAIVLAALAAIEGTEEKDN